MNDELKNRIAMAKMFVTQTEKMLEDFAGSEMLPWVYEKLEAEKAFILENDVEEEVTPEEEGAEDELPSEV